MLFLTSIKYKLLRQTLISINTQTCLRWELYIIVPDKKSLVASKLLSILKTLEIKTYTVIFSTHPPHKIASHAKDEYVNFISSGDVLDKDCVNHFFQHLHNNPFSRFIYTDHDLLTTHKQQLTANFKPDWNPDYLVAYNYISYAAIFYRDHLISLNSLNKPNNNIDYFHQLILSVTQRYALHEIHHLSAILFYFNTINTKLSTRLSLVNYFITNNHINHYRASFFQKNLPKKIAMLAPLVSIIIPTKNQYLLLKQCIDGLLKRTSYSHIEILVIDNQSNDSKTLAYLESLSSNNVIKILHYSHSFNYSAINNFAVKQAKGALIALLNNDIKVTTSNWLSEMVTHALRPEIGCVGAKLYYPDGTIQHGGVILGIKGTASHAHKYFPADHAGYFNRLRVTHNVSAVTAACLVMRKALFEEAGGFDEVNLKVAYNDVDLCLKVLDLGYRNLWTPHAELIHYESKSRGKKRSWWQRRKLRKEARFLQRKWGKLLLNDPCYNPNLTLEREDFSLKNSDKS
jgi:GT2 family glycosyltransferase